MTGGIAGGDEDFNRFPFRVLRFAPCLHFAFDFGRNDQRTMEWNMGALYVGGLNFRPVGAGRGGGGSSSGG